MKRRNFIHIAGGSIILNLLLEKVMANNPIKFESAVKLEIGQQLPDPFCIRIGEEYYLTGTHSTRRMSKVASHFDIFYSRDLVNWESLGPILKMPEYEGSRQANYWAPEIFPYRGKYYLYYTADSFGDPYRRFVRVAVGEQISGPYEDSGVALTEQPSIDGHPFSVSEDESYLFYTGNEGNDHMGQLLVDRFVSPVQLDNKPRKVFPSETVPWEEGAFVIKSGSTFFLFSSQGNWRNETYHVLASKAKSILGPYERCKDESGNCKVVKTTGNQFGPGHNSIFRGPGSSFFICYHAWDKERTGRYPWIAPLQWKEGFPYVKSDK